MHEQSFRTMVKGVRIYVEADYSVDCGIVKVEGMRVCTPEVGEDITELLSTEVKAKIDKMAVETIRDNYQKEDMYERS